MRPTIAAIVEGHGEVSAVPILLRRLASEVQCYELDVPTPIRCRRSKIVRQGGSVHVDALAHSVELAARKLRHKESGSILVLLDAEEDCPAQLGPAITGAVARARPDVRASVVLAKRMYEAWLMASAASLRADGRLPADAPNPTDPEGIVNPKRTLSRWFPVGHRYSERVDQPALTATFDLDQAGACPSFVKLRKEVHRLIEEMRSEATEGTDS